ncbi:asparagine synthase (glutamine-hydrolyzing) [Salinibacter sp.]|uniref:asparagine synthase (glutamine-hydrolyzing) n=1 Tax=Salinibacter sp. TaxID=2065818 RepID=UPI0021E90980|nr:asparagine synthase (glutamine-hydrolyzing) [Salinibacter sp.]
MCGIAATFCYGEGRIGRGELVQARECMRARGPDASGYWESDDRRVGLAHRRLSIIDLSEQGAQPMADESRGVQVVYNGEIYNHQRLRKELEGKGYQFQSDTDTEVLLYLYAEHGRTFVERLRGMYAFALYDPVKRGLLMARDPYGIKPLYYADDGHTMRVASQVQALRKYDAVNTSMDPAGHVGFFLWGHVPEPHTLYQGIRALPAGHTCWVDQQNGPEAPRSFASVPGALQQAEAQPNGRPPRPALREALLDSVRHHLIADVDVGLFLSAGLDSATLTALASEVHDQVKTVTLGFEEFRGTHDDEVPGAERIAERYGTDHETVWVRQDDFAAAHNDFFAAMDQPTIDGANSYFVSRAAREAGLKVALSGVGGDELFGGYPSFSQIPRLVSTVGSVPGAATVGTGLRVVSEPVIKRMTSPKYAGLLEYGDDYAGGYLLRRGLYMPWELPDVLDPDLVEEGWAALQPLARLRQTADGISNEHLRVTALESCWYMRSQLLRDTDWASMARSLEVRTPLVDHHLLSQVAPLVAHHGLTKQDMARTPAEPLPEDLLDRPKSGFTVPVREWLLQDRPEYEDARGLRGWAQYVYNRHT